MINIDKVRNKIAGMIMSTKLPGAAWLGLEIILSKKSQTELTYFSRVIVNSIQNSANMIKTLAKLSYSCEKWLVPEHIENLLIMEYPESKGAVSAMVVRDALSSMRYFLGGEEYVAMFFDRYVSDEASFRAVMQAFFSTNQHLAEQGMFDLAAGQFVNIKNREELAALTVCNHLTKQMIRLVADDRWDYDTLLSELNAFPDFPN